MYKNWWKVAVYCTIASFVCFQLELHFFMHFSVITMTDGTITTSDNITLLVAFLEFITVVLFGGCVCFRNMSRRDLFYSCSVLAVLNLVFGVIVRIENMPLLGMIWGILTEWDNVVPLMLIRAGVEGMMANLLVWLLPPFIFILFGKEN